MAKALDKWQFGDFQTPDDLAACIVEVLKRNHHVSPDIIIEPTCGKGAFVRAALNGFSKTNILAYEVNPAYVEDTMNSIDPQTASRVSVKQGDFFLLDWEEILDENKGSLLILGNPPWVTSSELGILTSKNLPEKTNFHGRRGIEAITGSGNFDISEWMLLRHVDWLVQRSGTLAMLCKYSVARKIMRRIRQSKEHCLFGHIYSIDAMKYFSAAVDACLFVLTTDGGNADCEVYDNLDASEPIYVIGERDGYVVRDIATYEEYRELRGQDSAYIWRSGLKHDCSKVMELTKQDGVYVNGLKEVADIEEDFVYPLLKSSDIGNSRTASCRRWVVVTQKAVGESTDKIRSAAPKTYKYLEDHADFLSSRKSSIYRGKPPFSIFGVGEYTFLPWKVAISALYKRLNFCLVSPIDGKPVIFDDTVNFLSFRTEDEAKFVYSLLISDPTKKFYNANIFWEEKRPITAEILRRLSLKEVAKHLELLEGYMRCVDNRKVGSYSGHFSLGIAEKAIKYKQAKST